MKLRLLWIFEGTSLLVAIYLMQALILDDIRAISRLSNISREMVRSQCTRHSQMCADRIETKT